MSATQTHYRIVDGDSVVYDFNRYSDPIGAELAPEFYRKFAEAVAVIAPDVKVQKQDVTTSDWETV